MLESILYLVIGIIFINVLISLLGKKVDVLSGLLTSASVFFALYILGGSMLILIGMFSMNRTLMAVDAMAFVVMLAVWIIKKKPRPDIFFEYKKSVIPIMIIVVFVVVGIGIVNDGFFGMDSTLGVSQAKALNLTSKSDGNPFEADYLSALDEEHFIKIGQMNTAVAGKYDGYVAPIVAIFSFGAYFFGYSNMACGFLVLGACVICILWLALRRFKICPVVVGGIVVAFLVLTSLFFGSNSINKVKVSWNTIAQMDEIVSEYDVILLAPDIKDEYYVPLASVTQAKVYPMFSDLKTTIDEVRTSGERIYYITRQNINGKVSDDIGVYLKNVFNDSGVSMYRVLNFYRTHESVDTQSFIRSCVIFVLGLLTLISFMWAFASMFDRFDTACNICLSLAVMVIIYAVCSSFLMCLGIYEIAYAMAVTFMVSVVVCAVTISIGCEAYFLYNAKKTIGLIWALLICSIIMMIKLNKDLYPSYSTIGSNQLQALKYICRSDIVLENVGCNRYLTSLMALIGSIFGTDAFIWVLPVVVDVCVVVAFVVLERILSCIIKKNQYRRIMYTALNVCAVIMAVLFTQRIFGVMEGKNTIASWATLEAYQREVEPDDAVAIQRASYPTYAYPIQMMTGVHTMIEAVDFDDAVSQIDNRGKDTYYVTSEIMDPTYERLNIIAHMNGEYMYRFYAYLTERGIYSVNDSVVQGFYNDKDRSGMAWTCDENAFIQCDIPYKKYDTVRLYLGDKIKLDQINLEYIELEFRENWHYVSKEQINADNNGKYIDFKLDWSYMVDGYNVIYFHSSVMWSPLIYGDVDTRTMGFPFLYIQFLNLEED